MIKNFFKRTKSGILIIPILFTLLLQNTMFPPKVLGAPKKTITPEEKTAQMDSEKYLLKKYNSFDNYDLKEQNKAKSIAEDFIKQFPDNKNVGQAQRLIIKTYLSKRKFKEALKEAERIVSENNGKEQAAGAQMAIGDYYRYKSDNIKALSAYEKVIKNYPKSEITADASLEKGACLYALGKWDESIKVFEELISKYPNSAPANKAKQSIEDIKTMKRIKNK